MKNIRGSPPYYRRTFYDLLAMIRQLGMPTWFVTLSAADLKWPDMISTIAKQYGMHYSDAEIEAHCVIWTKDAPRYVVNSDEEVCAFID